MTEPGQDFSWDGTERAPRLILWYCCSAQLGRMIPFSMQPQGWFLMRGTAIHSLLARTTYWELSDETFCVCYGNYIISDKCLKSSRNLHERKPGMRSKLLCKNVLKISTNRNYQFDTDLDQRLLDRILFQGPVLNTWRNPNSRNCIRVQFIDHLLREICIK